MGFAADKSTVGDYFPLNRLERPFSAGDMEYFGDLDIIRVILKHDSPWFYVTITLADQLRENIQARYGLELDLDADGRGDFLIWTSLPSDEEWTTNGIQVFEDSDGDLGGLIPLQIEDPNPALNGYETLIFDEGIGDDPDLAWVRRDPTSQDQLNIAFKDSIPGATGFLWSAWADGGVMDPGLFEYNDQFSMEDAGSPHHENPAYPIDQVFQADSTCRSWYGMTPTGLEPGLCISPQENKPDKQSGPEYGYCPISMIAVIPCICAPSCPRGATCIGCALP